MSSLISPKDKIIDPLKISKLKGNKISLNFGNKDLFKREIVEKLIEDFDHHLKEINSFSDLESLLREFNSKLTFFRDFVRTSS